MQKQNNDSQTPSWDNMKKRGLGGKFGKEVKVAPSNTVRRLSRLKSTAAAVVKAQRSNKKKGNSQWMVATDFLRFLKQRTGWMGRDGCLVPAAYCHELNEERTYFSIALQKANEYLVENGLRYDRPLSGERMTFILENWPPEFETLRTLATIDGKALSQKDFMSSVNQMFVIIKHRMKTVQKLLPNNEDERVQTEFDLGLRLFEEMSGLWGSRRQVQ